MKNLIICRFLMAALAITFLFSCKKDQEPQSKVDANGLTKDINDLVPDSILTIMQSLGLPIHGGETPPDIENTFFVTPFILKNSNIPDDFPGMSFADMSITFSEQDNDALRVKVDYINGPESGNGIGSFIVGQENKFSVFTQIDVMISGYPAKAVYVYSGEIGDCGIENFYVSNFMIDNFGNPGFVFIQNGEGRVIYDQDGFSEITSTSPKFDYQVPNGVPLVPQPNDFTCWAASMTMMIMWRDNASYSIATAMQNVGTIWRQKFEIPKGLTDSEWNQFTQAAGLKSVNFSPSIEGLNDLLRNGPLLVAIDEDPGPDYALHAKIITGISGHGGPGCTYVTINDPWEPNVGRQYTESYEEFMGKLEQLLGGYNYFTILHW